MKIQTLIWGAVFALAMLTAGCSREQSDWEKARTVNDTESYELFVKKYPKGTFTPQALSRIKELTEERDWQKARDADTPEAYQAFLKQYPEGTWTEEARIRVENFSLAQAPPGAPPAAEPPVAGGPASSGGSGPAATPATPTPGATGATPATPGAAGSATPGAQPKPAAKAANPPAGGGHGQYAIQLGAFKSGKKTAEERWEILKKKYPTILHGLSPHIRVTKTAAGPLVRLQVTGLTRNDSRALCKRLKAKSEQCLVVPPVHHAAPAN
jgi:cell division septation protein DedD